MTDLLPRVRSYIERHALLPGAGDPGTALKVVAGVSGGADSLVLLHLMRRLAEEKRFDLHVAHLNHGLRGEAADEDARFVVEIAGSWNLPCTVKVNPPGSLVRPGLSTEEAARNARYAFLARLARHTGAQIVAVGHHAGDQAETVLMHFLRGSGVSGLRGMLPRTRLAGDRLGSEGQGTGDLLLIRPLLDISREEIEAYCAERGIEPRFDATNTDVALYRNRLRHELLPILESYNPRIRSVLQRTATVMAGEFEILSRATAQAWGETVLDELPGEIHFRLAAWQALPTGLQRGLVRAAITRLRQELRNVNWEHVERAVALARDGETGQSATLTGRLALHLRPGRVIIGPEALAGRPGSPRVSGEAPLPLPGQLALGEGWRVQTRLVGREEIPPGFHSNANPWQAYIDAAAAEGGLVLRPRHPGDRFQPLGMGGHTVRVNEFMINAKVLREDRPAWPLLAAVWGIAWVCGLRLDERAAVRETTRHALDIRLSRE